MFLKFVYIFMVVLVLSAAGVYLSRHHELELANAAQNFRQNANLLGRYAAGYAGSHDTASGGVSPATAGVPSWYTPYPGISAYVNSGSAYVYYFSASNPTPQEALTYVAGPGITAGIKSGGAIKDATGRALPTSVQMPSGIPDGAMVLVSRDVMPTITHGVPGSGTQGAPGNLPPGAPLGGPETFPGFTSVPVPWTPVSPPWVNPPNSTIAAKPPYNPSTDPSVCASNGGMPYTATPVSIYAGVGGVMFGGGAVSSFRGKTTSRGPATGSYTVKISFDGAIRTLTLDCTRTNSTLGSAGDACSYGQSFAIGRGTFGVSLDTSSPLPGDWVRGVQAPFSATAHLSQLNCH